MIVRYTYYMDRLHQLALDHQLDPVWICEGLERVLYINQAGRSFFGIADDAPLSTVPALVQRLENPSLLIGYTGQVLESGTQKQTITIHRNGQEIIGTLNGTRIQNAGSATLAIMGFRDESAFVRLQQRMTQDEFFDRATGLLNRKVLDIMLELEIEKVQRATGEARLAVFMIQIRNLEQYRALCSQVVLDHVFEHIGNCVRQALRSNDLLFRYDDGRIIAIVTQYEWKSDLLIIAERLEDQIAIPFHPQDTDIHLQSCIGMSLFPEDGETSYVLVANAVTALNHALETGDSWLLYNENIHKQALDRLVIRSGLSKAIKENELELHYMPLVDRSRVVRGVEGLVRWRHPERGLLGPDLFIPIAVHSRIIGAISRWVMFRMASDIDTYFKDNNLFISINLSARDFADNYLSESLESVVGSRIDPSRIKIEITESECMQNPALSIAVMETLRRRGFQVVIDDFGIGQTSLALLRDIPANTVKIDQVFVQEIVSKPRELAFLLQIVKLCKLRDMEVVLEGVETEEQFALLCESGIDLYQGFLFGEPDLPR